MFFHYCTCLRTDFSKLSSANLFSCIYCPLLEERATSLKANPGARTGQKYEKTPPVFPVPSPEPGPAKIQSPTIKHHPASAATGKTKKKKKPPVRAVFIPGTVFSMFFLVFLRPENFLPGIFSIFCSSYVPTTPAEVLAPAEKLWAGGITRTKYKKQTGPVLEPRTGSPNFFLKTNRS